MPSRFHKKKLRDPDDINKTSYFKNDIITPILTSSSKVLNDNPAVITLEKIQISNRILFALEYSQSIITFYDSAYEKIIKLLDMAINHDYIDDVVQYAHSLRLYIINEIAKFKDIPGNSATVDELEIYKKFLLDVLQNILDGFEYNMILYRLNILKGMIITYKTKM